MSPEPNSTPAPEALASLGKLREILASVRNLEHLLASVHVGPKVLSHVVPDVADSCAPWKEQSTALIRFVAATLGLNQELSDLEDYSSHTCNQLEEALRKSSPGTFNAKKRLGLERQVLSLAPELSALVEHLEMLAEATWAQGLSLPLAELLCSRPDRGSDRPFLVVPVVGSTSNVEVSVPARMGLRAFGVLAGIHQDPDLILSITLSGESVELTFCRKAEAPPTEEPAFRSQLPAIRPIPPSVDVARALLGHYGGTVSDQGRRVVLPARISE